MNLGKKKLYEGMPCKMRIEWYGISGAWGCGVGFSWTLCDFLVVGSGRQELAHFWVGGKTAILSCISWLRCVAFVPFCHVGLTLMSATIPWLYSGSRQINMLTFWSVEKGPYSVASPGRAASLLCFSGFPGTVLMGPVVHWLYSGRNQINMLTF